MFLQTPIGSPAISRKSLLMHLLLSVSLATETEIWLVKMLQSSATLMLLIFQAKWKHLELSVMWLESRRRKGIARVLNCSFSPKAWQDLMGAGCYQRCIKKKFHLDLFALIYLQEYGGVTQHVFYCLSCRRTCIAWPCAQTALPNLVWVQFSKSANQSMSPPVLTRD